MSRPDRTTMEGMIWNANHVLEQALDPGTNGLPKSLFSDNLKAVILVSVVEVGFIFSGNVGSGIALAKKDDGTWSAPSAVGMSGVGWGFLVGGSLKDVIIFCYGDQAIGSITGETGLKLGGQAELTIGPFGRTGQLNFDATTKGVGTTVAVAYSKGAFLGASVEGAVVGARTAVNQNFYGMDDVTPGNILLGKVEIPEGKVTLINEVYDKLNKLQEGATAKPDAAEEQKKSQAKSVADAEAEKVKNDPDVVKVDANAEAAKGK